MSGDWNDPAEFDCDRCHSEIERSVRAVGFGHSGRPLCHECLAFDQIIHPNPKDAK